MPFFLDGDDDENKPFVRSHSDQNKVTDFFKEDRKFFMIGCTASIVTFIVVAYMMYSNSKPINLEELPVIQADPSPIKVKPKMDEMVKHQDKVVYDNISKDVRNEKEKVVQQPEEILSIPEVEGDSNLSEEEKRNIIQSFDELTPEKEYKVNYVKTKKVATDTKQEELKILEDNELTPIKEVIAPSEKSRKSLKDALKKAVPVEPKVTKKSASTKTKPKGHIMIQVGSVKTKASAELEYKRIARKNIYVKKLGKKIFKVDLGGRKGTMYRIQIGPFAEKKDALKTINLLKKNGFTSYISK